LRTAYAMSGRRDAETYNACVNNRTGAIRMLLNRRDGDCYTRRGPWQEIPISLAWCPQFRVNPKNAASSG
jgi:hypothetical protein